MVSFAVLTLPAWMENCVHARVCMGAEIDRQRIFKELEAIFLCFSIAHFLPFQSCSTNSQDWKKKHAFCFIWNLKDSMKLGYISLHVVISFCSVCIHTHFNCLWYRHMHRVGLEYRICWLANHMVYIASKRARKTFVYICVKACYCQESESTQPCMQAQSWSHVVQKIGWKYIGFWCTKWCLSTTVPMSNQPQVVFVRHTRKAILLHCCVPCISCRMEFASYVAKQIV